jgi:predicted PurR-regulated permease PerM
MNKNNTLLNVNLTIISLVIVFYILYIWASFIIPFVIALLLAFSIISTYSFIKKIIKRPIVSFFLAVIFYIVFFWVIVKVINSNVTDIIDKSSFYQDQLRFLIDKNVSKFWIKEWEFYQNMWNYIDLQVIFSTMTTLITSMLSYTWIIIFYLIFILLEYKFFSKKLDLMIKDKDKKKKIFDIIYEIKHDVRSYFFIKTFVSLLTWFFSYILMKSVWLDFALFWTFIIFVLNFIPNIWSVIAVFFPVILSLVQFNDYYHFFIVFSGLVFIQMIIWNIIDPKLTWNKLNLSPLVILLALVFWWLIWGVIWAILSVPIMVILSIIFSKFEETKSIAILLSEKWDVRTWVDIVFNKNKTKFIQKIKYLFVKGKI